MRTPASAGLLLAALAAGAIAADDAPPDGRAVMTLVDARPRGPDERLAARWRLIPKSGRERVRETRTYWRDRRGDDEGLHSQRLIIFDAPAPVKDTAFLVHSRAGAGGEDRRWVYLPALRKVRRIASGDRDKLFAGSDFSYEDLSERAVGEDEHRLLRREELDGVVHWVVESTPKGESGYERRVVYVHPERHTPSRIDFYARGDRLEKTLRIRWQQVDGIWAWRELEMDGVRRKHRTRIEVQSVEHDLGLTDDVFAESALRHGVP